MVYRNIFLSLESEVRRNESCSSEYLGVVLRDMSLLQCSCIFDCSKSQRHDQHGTSASVSVSSGSYVEPDRRQVGASSWCFWLARTASTCTFVIVVSFYWAYQVVSEYWNFSDFQLAIKSVTFYKVFSQVLPKQLNGSSWFLEQGLPQSGIYCVNGSLRPQNKGTFPLPYPQSVDFANSLVFHTVGVVNCSMAITLSVTQCWILFRSLDYHFKGDAPPACLLCLMLIYHTYACELSVLHCRNECYFSSCSW